MKMNFDLDSFPSPAHHLLLEVFTVSVFICVQAGDYELCMKFEPLFNSHGCFTALFTLGSKLTYNRQVTATCACIVRD